MFVLLRGRYNSRCIIGIRDTETFNKSYMAHRAHGSGHIVFYFAAHHESSAHWVLLPVLWLSVAGMTFVFLPAAGAAVTFGSVPWLRATTQYLQYKHDNMHVYTMFDNMQ